MAGKRSANVARGRGHRPCFVKGAKDITISGVSEGQRTDAGRARGVRGPEVECEAYYRARRRAAEESVHAAKPA